MKIRDSDFGTYIRGKLFQNTSMHAKFAVTVGCDS